MQLAHLCLKMRINGKVVEHKIELKICQGQMGNGIACYLASLCRTENMALL